jgi:hypothetical protein
VRASGCSTWAPAPVPPRFLLQRRWALPASARDRPRTAHGRANRRPCSDARLDARRRRRGRRRGPAHVVPAVRRGAGRLRPVLPTGPARCAEPLRSGTRPRRSACRVLVRRRATTGGSRSSGRSPPTYPRGSSRTCRSRPTSPTSQRSSGRCGRAASPHHTLSRSRWSCASPTATRGATGPGRTACGRCGRPSRRTGAPTRADRLCTP